MSDLLRGSAPTTNEHSTNEELVSEVHASFSSLGGIALTTSCVLLTLLALVLWGSSAVTPLQRAIVGLLAFAAWFYCLDSCTERLSLRDGTMIFDAWLSRKRMIPLDRIEAVTYVHQGFSLDHGMELIEIKQRGKLPEYLSLGPCWKQEDLVQLLETIQVVLDTSGARLGR